MNTSSIQFSLAGAAIGLFLLGNPAFAQGGGTAQPTDLNPKTKNTTQTEERIVEPDPGNAMNYRSEVGTTFYFDVTGSNDGSVWGTDIYTDDSSIAAAAVHAGILDADQSGVVAVTILGPQDSFEGSARNGVTSSDYGSWDGSFEFVSESDDHSTGNDDGGDEPPADDNAGNTGGYGNNQGNDGGNQQTNGGARPKG